MRLRWKEENSTHYLSLLTLLGIVCMVCYVILYREYRLNDHLKCATYRLFLKLLRAMEYDVILDLFHKKIFSLDKFLTILHFKISSYFKMLIVIYYSSCLNSSWITREIWNFEFLLLTLQLIWTYLKITLSYFSFKYFRHDHWIDWLYFVCDLSVVYGVSDIKSIIPYLIFFRPKTADERSGSWMRKWLSSATV